MTHPLAESWQRSRGYGLARADQHISFIKAGLLEERRSRNDWVPQRVQPLIEQLGAQITRQPAIVVIADADGLVLETRGNTDFLHKASRALRWRRATRGEAGGAPTPSAPRWRWARSAKCAAISITSTKMPD